MIVQEPICCSAKDLECVKKLDVNSSSCLKPCSGLHVTSFSKTAAPNGLENLAPLLKDYDKYKKITEYPRGQSGNYANNNDNEIMSSGMLDKGISPLQRTRTLCPFLAHFAESYPNI